MDVLLASLSSLGVDGIGRDARIASDSSALVSGTPLALPPNFTPSTIPASRPQDDGAGPSTEIKVVGNLVVAGGQDLRVFEIREVTLPVARPSELSDVSAQGKLEADVQRGLDEEMSSKWENLL